MTDKNQRQPAPDTVDARLSALLAQIEREPVSPEILALAQKLQQALAERAEAERSQEGR